MYVSHYNPVRGTPDHLPHSPTDIRTLIYLSEPFFGYMNQTV